MATKPPTQRATLRYSGPALETGSMDVRDFGPALLSFADLVQQSASVAYGPEARVRVRVRSDFRKGSMIANLDLYLEGATQLAAFAVGQYGPDFATLLQLVGVHQSAAHSVVSFLKWLRGRKETQVIRQDNGSIAVQVEGNGNTVLVVPPEVYALAKDDNVRRAAFGVARPVEQQGVDALEFKEGRKVAARITSEDAKSLQAAIRVRAAEATPPVAEKSESEDVLTVDLLQGVFSEVESFRFFDGENKFWARISDQDWWASIHARTDGYYDGDRMRVRIMVRQGVDAKGNLFKEREIVEVLWHEHKPQQADLFDEDQEGSARG